jgi:hypothetical protein
MKKWQVIFVVGMVAVAATAVGALVILKLFLSTPPPRATSGEPINIPDGTLRLTLTQRTSEIVPKSGGRLNVFAGDVSGDSVMITVDGPGVSRAMKMMKQGDELEFEMDHHPYRLHLAGLSNQLFGGDYVIIEIASTAAGTSDRNPREIIEMLIAEIESAEVTFIRNGSEHAPDEAAAHLRRKLSFAGDRIQTPEQFIEHLASYSSSSGKPYLIKLTDGRQIEAKGWLYDLLKDIRERAAAEPEKQDPAAAVN